jgi:hypothetical protein
LKSRPEKIMVYIIIFSKLCRFGGSTSGHY